MSATGWIAASYLLVGLIFGAAWWHIATSSEVIEQICKDMPRLRAHPARGFVYHSLTALMTLLATVLWPALAGWLVFSWTRVRRGDS